MILELSLKVLSWLLYVFAVIGILFIVFVVYSKNKAKQLSKQMALDKQSIKAYFEKFNSNNPIAVIDETPRLVEIGGEESKRQYLIRPLKYRQITRLCILFAKTLGKMKDQKINLDDADVLLPQIIELCEDDFFLALTYILFFSKEQGELDEMQIKAGIDAEYEFIKSNATLNQLSNILSIIVMQNDIKNALASFGRLAVKKN